MRSKLLETQSNTFFLFVEVEYNDIDFFVEFHYFVRVVDTSPAEVCDMDKTIDTAKVYKYTIRGNVLDDTLEHLSFFEARDNLFALLFEFLLDKGFVRYDNVFEFVIDFYNLEFHGFTHKHIIIAYGFDVDLRAGQECFYSEYFYYHTAFGTAFDVSVYYLLTFESSLYLFPSTCMFGEFVRE